MIDNNSHDPTEPGAIDQWWAVDDPSAICEEGNNLNGVYVMYAGGIMEEYFYGYKPSPGAPTMWSPDTRQVSWTLPVRQIGLDMILGYGSPVSGAGSYGSSSITVQGVDTHTIHFWSEWFNSSVYNDTHTGQLYFKSYWYYR